MQVNIFLFAVSHNIYIDHEFKELELQITDNNRDDVAVLLEDLERFGHHINSGWTTNGNTITFNTLNDTLAAFKKSPPYYVEEDNEND